MVDLIEQFALLDALLINWGAIRSLLGPSSAAMEAELGRIAARLAASRSPGEIAVLVDDLLELAADTPAETFIGSLVARSSLGPEETRRIRSSVSAAPQDLGQLHAAEAHTLTAGRALGRAVPAVPGAYPVPVFFATNRTREEDSAGNVTLGGELSPELTLGMAHVTIPVDVHKIGTLERPRWWNLFSDEMDERRYVALLRVERLDQSAFVRQLSRAVGEESKGDLLVFLHGYRVTFEDAARRAAQFAYDLKFHGAVVLFSWPSLGSLWGYFADEERAAVSAERLASFLHMLEGGPWRNVHLVAHSMGNRVLLLGLADNPRPKLPLGQVVLVAADVYVDAFRQKYPKMARGDSLPTSYASNADRALLISSWIHRAERIGIVQGEPFVMEQLETVDATAVDTSLVGHSYFSDERSVLTDLGFLIREGLSAARRGLDQRPGQRYWKFPD